MVAIWRGWGGVEEMGGGSDNSCDLERVGLGRRKG